MLIDNMKNASFSPSSEQDWKEKAEESLKGKKLETLNRNTYENMVLKPLYTKLDQTDATGYPGFNDYRRGINALGYYSNPWKIAQKVSYHTIEELGENLSEALKRGQDCLSFQLKKGLFDVPEKLEKFLVDFIDRAPFALQADGFQRSFLALLISSSKKSDINGYIAEDPLSFLVTKGSLAQSFDFHTWADTIQDANQHFPNLKTILIDTTPYHNGGANAVQEIAIALATGVYYLEVLKTHGLDQEGLFEKIIFKFQIGANFFMELAKLRVARVLWDKIGEAYGIGSENRKMTIIAETSSFTKTLNDPHVNILRAGNEAFAAVLGGVQYLQVHAFSELESVTPLAERLARNTQLILREEAFLQNIVDPAGGSWYVESLTNELVEKAWEYFLTIDEKGGLLDVLKSNWLQSEISSVFNKRQEDTFTRKQSIVGSNVYANLQESLKEHLLEEEGTLLNQDSSTIKVDDITTGPQQESLRIQPIKSKRLAEPFEELRQRAHNLKNNHIGLICLGDLKANKARADFMTGFLAAGGFAGVRSQDVNVLSDVKAFINESKLTHFVLCSSNEVYSEIGLELLKQLVKEFPEFHFFLAGLPEKDNQAQWIEAGIREFVHLKTNCYEFNSTIMTELEGVN